MDVTIGKSLRGLRIPGWRCIEKSPAIILYIILFVIQTKCQTIFIDDSRSTTKRDINNLENNLEISPCHTCHNSTSKSDNNNNLSKNNKTNYLDEFVIILNNFVNITEEQLENELENTLDDVLHKDRYEIIEGVEIKPIQDGSSSRDNKESEGRALFSKYTYEYRLYQKVKNFFDTHILSINIPKAASIIGFRSFGLKKFFIPLLIGAQVFKSIILAMFLPSILGSFGKILGKGISQLSAASSQASYPPANAEDQPTYNNDNKDFMGYETNSAGTYSYPDAMEGNENDLASIDLFRFGAGDQKVSYLPSKNAYYKNQMSNNYKVFQKIPASSMILSNYDPFYSPLLSRLDGIFARLGLAPSENSIDSSPQIGGQTLSDVKLEACREQLICLMYASPAKYAPYSNLISAQLSRELNELRRPVSDNPEILRFFRYMRAARRGQEGMDCIGANPACAANAAPEHTMIAAYHDINKLVTARKLKN